MKTNKDNLGDRMKNYENVTRNYLMTRNPVIIRLDGKAFHTFTKGFNKPFDDILIESMWETAKYLCQNIQGCRLAYVQSDEISLLLTDYEKLDTSAWFDNNIQKMVSVSASMATLSFNKAFSEIAGKYISCLEYYNSEEDEEYIFNKYGVRIYLNEYEEHCVPDYALQLKEVYKKKIMTAMFDSRIFSLPKEEVVNYFLWREQDAMRNSVQMVSRANFSHKELHKKSTNDIKDMLLTEKDIRWDSMDVYKQRGACIIRESYSIEDNEDTVRSRWVVDKHIPIFSENREYISRYL